MVYALISNVTATGRGNLTRDGQLSDLERDTGWTEADATTRLQNFYQGRVVQILNYNPQRRELYVSVDGQFTSVNVDGLKRAITAYL